MLSRSIAELDLLPAEAVTGPDRTWWTLYTDGACAPNPGPGGWGYVLRHQDTGREWVERGGCPATTSNRMELVPVLRALGRIGGHAYVEVVSDSLYVVRPIQDRLRRVLPRGARSTNRANFDLWITLAGLIEQHTVMATHCAGHAGHRYQEYCDRLAVRARSEIWALDHFVIHPVDLHALACT